MDNHKYKTLVALNLGHKLGDDNPTTQPIGSVKGLPRYIWGPDSWDWEITITSDGTTAVSMASATCKLYISYADVTDAAAVEISTGAVSGAGNNIVTFVVDAGDIPTAYYGFRCCIWATLTATGKSITVRQYVNVENNEGTGTQSVAAAYISYTPTTGGDWIDTDPDDVAEALDDLAAKTSSIGVTAKVTDDGGLAIRMTNKTGGASVKGTVVSASATTALAFNTTAGDGYDAFGVVYEAGIADGSECWVTVSGIADVLLKDTTASTVGNWVKVSDTAGRADASAGIPSPPTDTNHFREIGHALETQTGGTSVLCKVMLHFN